MGAMHLLAEVDVDHNGEVFCRKNLTLGSLSDRCGQAIGAGIPLDSEVKFGYVPAELSAGLYVERPRDYAAMNWAELKSWARCSVPADAGPAWAEIERRIRTGEWID